MEERQKAEKMTKRVVERVAELPQLLFPVEQGSATQTTS